MWASRWPTAEGFVASLIRLMALDLEAPDHTTLSRRSASVTLPPPVPIHAGPIHLIIDSTGLKIVGDGEWLVMKHKSGQRDGAIARIAEVGRRRWRKEAGAHRQARAENACSDTSGPSGRHSRRGR